MSADSTLADDKALTLVWRTLGIEDQSLELDEAHTITMRSAFRPEENSPRELVQRLPRLLQRGGVDTMPELRVKGTLGEGGMGHVTLAEQLSLGRDVAVKKVRDESRSPSATLVLLREGWTTGRLEHPNIVPVYSLGRGDNDEPVIVMKKIAGTSWAQIIADFDQVPDAFDASDPFELHVEVLSQVCNAVHYAHSRQIIHRDLKPDNVMLGEFGEVYVLDWGIAVSLEDDPSGRLALAKDVTQPTGTPAYMAPEMARGVGAELGVHTDVFLLGAMLFEALTGRAPYTCSTLFGLMLKAYECPEPVFEDHIPPELAMICRRAMQRDPSHRFSSARELRDALTTYRRRRQSRLLAKKGESRLQQVRHLIDLERSGDTPAEASLYKVFGECRFAFEQALEITDSDPSARQGLQSALETMADRELTRGAHKAASLLINELPHPSPSLSQRLDLLGQRLADREEEFANLQRFRHAVDLEVGRRSRTVFAVIMGLIWAIGSMITTIIVEFGWAQVTYPRALIHIVFINLILVAVIFLGRRRFFDNLLNKRMLLAVATTLFLAIVHRLNAWLLQMPMQNVITTEMLIYSAGAFIIAVTSDRRVATMGASFLLASLCSAIWPPATYWLFSAANVVGMMLLVWIWWPNNPEKAPRRNSLSAENTS